MIDRTAAFYSGPFYAFRGAGFPVYSRSRRKRGESILGALKNMLMPLGRIAAKEAVGLAGDVVGDMFQGKKLTQSLKSRGLKRLKNVGLGGLQAFSSTVSRKRPPPKKKSFSAKRRRGLF